VAPIGNPHQDRRNVVTFPVPGRTKEYVAGNRKYQAWQAKEKRIGFTFGTQLAHAQSSPAGPVGCRRLDWGSLSCRSGRRQGTLRGSHSNSSRFFPADIWEWGSGRYTLWTSTATRAPSKSRVGSQGFGDRRDPTHGGDISSWQAGRIPLSVLSVSTLSMGWAMMTPVV